MKLNQLFLALLAMVAVACGTKNDKEGVGNIASTASVASNTKVDDHAGHNHGSEAGATTTENNGKVAKFQFEETEHQFGDINQGDVVEHVFKFKNVGEVPLVITNTKVTCGCTTPSYTKEPIAPGESGELQVKFNSAGKSGNQTKVVTIMANVEGGQDKVTIYTNVKAASKEGPLAN